MPPGGLIPLKFQLPKNRFEGLFSMPYALAVSLLHDSPTLVSFTEATVHSDGVARLLSKIDAREDESTVVNYPNYQQMSYGSRGEVQVSVETTDGRSGTHAVAIAPGHPKREVTWEQMRAKFEDGAAVAGFETSETGPMYAAIASIDTAPSFGKVVDLLGKPSSAFEASAR